MEKLDIGQNGKAKQLPQYIAAFAVCLGAVGPGTLLGWTSNISDGLKNSTLNGIPVDDESLGWIGSMGTIGSMMICFPIGYICDAIGRKWACLITVVPFTVGWLLIICSNRIWMIYAGRFFTGFGGGGFCIAAPMYTSEISQKEIRGILGSFFQLLLTVGILISYVAGAFMSPQGLSILCAAFPILFATVFFFQPETPVYYAKNNRMEDALKSLQGLRGNAYNCDNEIKEIKEALEKDIVNVSFFEAASTRASKYALMVCFGLIIFLQMSGVSAVIFYTGDIFLAANSSLAPTTATIIIGVVQVIGTFISSLTVDKFGRKILLLCSIFFMMFSGLVMGIFFSLKDRNVLDEDGISKIGFLPILCLIVFITAFSLGFGPVPWIIFAELMPHDIKSVAVAATVTFNWLLTFIVTRFYSNLKNSIGGDSTFYIFAGISFIGVLFVYFLVPETKGKSLYEVQVLLSGQKPSDRREGIDNPTFKN